MKSSEYLEFIYTQKTHYNFRHAVYMHTVSHTFGTQKYSTDFCYSFLITVPYLGIPIFTAYILVKTECCQLLRASIGLLR